MNVFEMEGFLRGKCLPGDMKVNETTAEYLVRKLSQTDELTAALSTLESAREVTNCPEGVDLKDHLKALVAENVALASENVSLKNVFGPGDAVLNFLTIALRHTTYDQIDLDDVTLAFQMSLPKIPATDSILLEAEVRGVVKLKEHLNEWMSGMDFPSDMQFEHSEFISACDGFTAKLRGGKAE